jgi:Spy/CpxP family protein refolding chaperone
MNRIRLLAIGTVLMFALTAAAQQAAPSGTNNDEQSQSAAPSMPPVERHLQMLAEKLDLTSDQQDKARPILEAMHDAMGKAEQNQGLSDDERKAQKHAAFMKADKQLREVLSDGQKKALDQLEQEMHPGLHSNADGAATQPQQN